jgi:pimeloyl-ACP methyl ester carboxylesterase
VPEWLLASGDFAVLDALVQQSLGDRDVEDVFGCDHRERRAEALPDETALNAAVNYYRAAARFADEMRDRYAKGPPITRPTLVIWGEDDPALGVELTRGLETLVPGTGRGPRIELLAGCSHWPQQEEPAKVTALLRAFLASAPPATRGTAPDAGVAAPR